MLRDEWGDSYLVRLTTRLVGGLARLPAEARLRHAAYLAAAQNADGGFSGREGGSDLYYTGFALRGLAVLERLTPDVCNRAAGFLRQSIAQQTSVVDFFSFLYACLLAKTEGPDVLADSPADWPERVAAVGTWQMIHGFETPLPRQDDAVEFLAGMASMEGGLRANDRAPLADLLSTFTGCWTLDQLGGLGAIREREALRYAQALELPG